MKRYTHIIDGKEYSDYRSTDYGNKQARFGCLCLFISITMFIYLIVRTI